MNKSLTWITGDYFLQVDIPIIKGLSKLYNINWVIVIGKEQKYYSPIFLKNYCSKNNINFEIIKNSPASSFKLFFQQLKLLKKIKKNESDFYYFNFYGLPYLYFIYKFYLDPNVVLFAIHNVKVPNGNKGERVETLYQKFGIRNLNKILTFSKDQFELANKKFPTKVIYNIPLPLTDFGLSNTVKSSSKIHFLFFGNITVYKRLDIFINAVEQLGDSLKNKIFVTIAGQGNAWENYKDLIKTKNIYSLVIKRVPEDKVSDLFTSNHYLVLPYQDIAQSGPLKIAFNYRLPVIASNLESFKEDVFHKENGFIFKKNNVESLKDVLEYIINNHDFFYNDMKKNLDNYVNENLSIESIENQYCKMFNKELCQS